MLSSRETETSIIGSILYDSSIFPRIYRIVKPEDFFDPVLRYIYRTMGELFANNIEINLKTLLNEFSKRGYTEVSEAEMREYFDYRVPADSAISFAAQVSEFSGYRILEFELGNLRDEIKSISLSDAIQRLSSLSRKVNEKGVRQEFSTGTVLTQMYIEMLSRERAQIKLTGIPEIDDKVVDFDAKEVTYIAARPGVGKTAIILQSIRTNLELGKRVGLLTLEMSSAKVLNRLISARAMADGSELLRMNPKVFRSNGPLAEALSYFQNAPLIIDDTGPFTNVTVPQKIRKMVYEYGCEIVYLDYIGLVNASGSLASSNRNMQLTQISSDLKGVASELNIPVVAAAQLNREVTKRVGGRPSLADLRDSGSLEQDASLVMFLYIDTSSILSSGITDNVEEYMSNSVDLPIVLDIQKQRNGPLAMETVLFKKPFGRFQSMSEQRQTY